jgi:hypothetical protein
LCTLLQRYNYVCIAELILYISRACPQSAFYTLHALVPLTKATLGASAHVCAHDHLHLESYKSHLDANQLEEGETENSNEATQPLRPSPTGGAGLGGGGALTAANSLPLLSNVPSGHTWTDLVTIVLIEIVKTSPADFTVMRELLEEVSA